MQARDRICGDAPVPCAGAWAICPQAQLPSQVLENLVEAGSVRSPPLGRQTDKTSNQQAKQTVVVLLSYIPWDQGSGAAFDLASLHS